MLMERRGCPFKVSRAFHYDLSVPSQSLTLTICTYDKFEVKWRPKLGAINSSQVAKG
jgi:hypothetical protein